MTGSEKRPVLAPISERVEMPSRREGYTQKVEIEGHKLYLRFGEYDDKKLGEIFLDFTPSEREELRGLLSCFAVAVSLGLQYGVPLEEYVDAFVFTKFQPSGMVWGSDRVKMCSSIVDYIFRELAIHYLDRDDLAHQDYSE